MQWIIKKIVGSKNQRDIRRMNPMVERTNRIEEEFQALSDDELKAKSVEIRGRLADGTSTDEVLEETFAMVKNACRRLVGMRYEVAGHEREWVEVPYDVQLVGGIAMHRGMIAEMATGEGKTLVGIMPAVLNALTGRGVHIVTVNDYLARRDAEWMGLLYDFLGISVGCIQNSMRPDEKRVEYEKDITYGTNSEFGFDYLRDNMSYNPEDKVHREYYYAIIDEIDSILIDEAKTPLIISGPAPNAGTGEYLRLKPAVERVVRKQRDLLNQFMDEAEKLLEKKEDEEAMYRLYQVNQGNSKNKRLLAMKEDIDVRRMFEKLDNQMLTDTHKEKARELREALYFTMDEKGHDASLTERGCEVMNPDDLEMFVLPDITEEMALLDGDESLTADARHRMSQEIQEVFTAKSETIHTVDQLIRAYGMYERDVDYVVQNNQVVIVDENTGRLMSGRRWSDGLHQAVEAKEGVKIERETQTLATITIQNYFRMYEKLAGMTGTAETEADEFAEIYTLDVLVVPTNRPVRRADENDAIYKTQREKYHAIVAEVEACHKRKQPVLVGTVTVEISEVVSRMLRKKGIPHAVLNAKNHATEADIVMRAGQPGAVTIATNMAGRGTDIKLGEGVVQLPRDLILSQTGLDDKYEGTTLRKHMEEHPCGLRVIATERHESRRIDRQLRGRCSRQGDPGSSRFFVSLEDDLMRLFGADRISNIMGKLGMEEGEVMEHPWLDKSVERAQRKVEEHNFSIRKRTLEYDDVMNQQREIVYGLRSELLVSDDVRPTLYDIIEEVIGTSAEPILADSEEGLQLFCDWANHTFPLGLKPEELEAEPTLEGVVAYTIDRVIKAYELKVTMEDAARYAELERFMMLQSIDMHWQEYLRAMDGLRESVGLRAYGQKDPLVEFKHEAYTMFADLMEKISEEMAMRAFRSTTSADAMQRFLSSMNATEVHSDVSAMGLQRQQEGGALGGAAQQLSAPGQADVVQDAIEKAVSVPITRDEPKVGRNDPCPCGSGKKYKKCHGAL